MSKNKIHGSLYEPKFIPRDYQKKWIYDVFQSLAKHKKTMGQLPTGGGKTVCFNEIARRCLIRKRNGVSAPIRCLILAHREELINQAQQKLFIHCGVRGGIIMGNARTDYSLPVQIASVQSLVNRPKPPGIGMIITDEAHHALAASYRKIYDAYPDAYHLGVSATPVRASGEGFEKVYNDLVTGPSVKWMEDNNFLCPAEIFHYPLDYIKLSGLDLQGGDYKDKDLSKLMDNAQRIADAVESWGTHSRGEQTVCFAVDVRHSKNLIAAYKAAGVQAAHIDGTTDKETRRRLIRNFEQGKIQILSNVGIATEGTDIPAIQTVQCLRPTTSLSLYLQMVGRGARILPGKNQYKLLDHANLIFEHGYPAQDREWSLIGKKVTKKERERQPLRQFKLKLEDGSEQIVNARNIPKNLKGVKLIPLSKKDFIRMDLDKFDALVRLAKQKGYNKGWCFHRWIEKKQSLPTLEELKYIREKLGYKPGWEKYKLRDLTEIFNKVKNKE